MHITNPDIRKNNTPGNPPQDLSLIVTIPACNEPGILDTLKALSNCTRPPGSVEVLVVLNSPECAEEKILDANLRAESGIIEFSAMNTDKNFHIHCLHRKGIPEKIAGAGYARKIAMDLASRRFFQINNPDGIILSLDSDTLCDPDYLTEVDKHFRHYPRSNGCSIYFEHPVEGKDFPPAVYKGIIQYELHLRYFIQALRYAGHPHAFHTLGSCFAVRAGVYTSQGGMNKRKAGEDFYFLHKIIPLGHFNEINTTCLRPSPRPSMRVPFGTGPAMTRFSSGEIKDLFTYDPGIFEDIRLFLRMHPDLYRASRNDLKKISFPACIREFLGEELYERIEEINLNTSNQAAFSKRFFRWFGVFMVIRIINHAHRTGFKKLPVEKAAREFLQRTDPASGRGKNALELLLYLRKVQRKYLD